MQRSTRGKIIFWLILAILFALLYFQNRAFFEHSDRLDLDLFLFDFSTPTLPVAVFYIGFFFAGFLVAFFAGMIRNFRLKKECQRLGTFSEERNRPKASPGKTAESTVVEEETLREEGTANLDEVAEFPVSGKDAGKKI